MLREFDEEAGIAVPLLSCGVVQHVPIQLAALIITSSICLRNPFTPDTSSHEWDQYFRGDRSRQLLDNWHLCP